MKDKLITLCVCDVTYGFPINWMESYKAILNVQKLYADSRTEIVGLVEYPDFEILSKKHLKGSFIYPLFNKLHKSPSDILEDYITSNKIDIKQIKEIFYFSSLSWFDSGMVKLN